MHTHDEGGGIAGGMIVGIVVALLVILLFAFMIFGWGGTATDDEGGGVDVDVPAPQTDPGGAEGDGGATDGGADPLGYYIVPDAQVTVR